MCGHSAAKEAARGIGRPVLHARAGHWPAHRPTMPDKPPSHHRTPAATFMAPFSRSGCPQRIPGGERARARAPTWRWNMSFSMSIPATLSERIGSPSGDRIPAHQKAVGSARPSGQMRGLNARMGERRGWLWILWMFGDAQSASGVACDAPITLQGRRYPLERASQLFSG